MSQGDLSARVHFLKREEGGYPEMCEVSEKIYKEGILEGKKEGKKEVAKELLKMKLSMQDIAKATGLIEEETKALQD